MRLLVVVDYQHDFVDGALGSKAAQDIYNKVAAKINEYSEDDDYVIFTRDTHLAGSYLYTNEGQHLPIPHCIYETKGWELMDDLYDEENPNHHIVNKHTFGFNWWWEAIDEFIDGISNPDVIEVIGVCTDICVISNALVLKSLYPEAQFYVDAACCAGTSEEAHKAALTVMKSCQIDITNE